MSKWLNHSNTGGPLALHEETHPQLEPVGRGTAVDAITEQMRARILSGAWAAGAKLLSERELAQQLAVNRLTLRAALARLEALGLVATQHGIGTVVRDFRQHGGIESLPELLAVMRTRDSRAYIAHVRDVLELRRAVATEAVALAAARHTQEDLVLLESLAALQRGRVRDVVAFARGDVEFARAVVRAGRNLALELLLNTVARFPDEDPMLTRAMYPKPRAQQRMYAPLIALIASRDVQAAREALRATLEGLDRTSQRAIEREVMGGTVIEPTAKMQTKQLASSKRTKVKS
ncbi:MAG: GntR family transcriptional regulator [Deltaproteobacteria bacterium]|nr:GntR family transcriptional regulator [Deltaproteobacteria bacterium]